MRSLEMKSKGPCAGKSCRAHRANTWDRFFGTLSMFLQCSRHWRPCGASKSCDGAYGACIVDLDICGLVGVVTP